MDRIWKVVCLVGLVTVALFLSGASFGSNSGAYVYLPQGDRVFVISESNNQISTIIPSNVIIDRLLFSPDGTKAYGWPYSFSGTSVVVLDTTENRMIDTIQVGDKDTQIIRIISVFLRGEKLYVILLVGKPVRGYQVRVVDLTLKKVVQKFNLGEDYLYVNITPDARKIVTVRWADRALLLAEKSFILIDIETNETKRVNIPAPSGWTMYYIPVRGAFAHYGEKIFVRLFGMKGEKEAYGIGIMDMATEKVSTFELEGHFPGGDRTLFAAPPGNILYGIFVSLKEDLAVIDLEAKKIINKTFPKTEDYQYAPGGHEVIISKNGKKLFYFTIGAISILDVDTMNIVAKIEIP